jgi:hypothetical protein
MYRNPRLKTNTDFPFIILGHISFILLFAFALFFFKERVLFSDSAFQFFKIINYEKINIEASRYGAILPQLPVLIAIKCGISLKHLTILYSASFVLIYYLVFLLCLHWFKNIAAALSVILVLTLCVSQSFFHPVTETHQSLVFSVFLYAILQYNEYRHSIVQYLLAVAVISTSFLAHPVALYTNTFIIGYTALENKQLKLAKPYLLLMLVVSMAVAKVLLTSENSYEGKFFSEIINSPSIILDLPKVYSTQFFIGRLNGLYFWVTILEIILIVKFISSKNFTVLIWQLGTLTIFQVITLLTYNKGDSTMLMERAFMPLALFVSIPLLKEIFANKQYMIYKFVFLAVVISLSLTRIYKQGNSFRTRTEFNQEMLRKTAQFSNRKFIIESGSIQKHFNTFWSHSFETLILSTISEEVPTQTIYPANNIHQLTKYTEDATDVFLGADFWLEWGIKDLNPRYFELPTHLPYKVVKIEDL